MICAFCNETIDDDSFYCDQCGEAIKICQQCGKPGKANNCTVHGTPLIFKKDAAQNASSQASPANAQAQQINTASQQNQSASASTPSPSASTPPPSASTPSPSAASHTTQTQRPSVNGKLFLHNSQIGASLEFTGTAMIGRGLGPHMNFFAAYITISRKHAQIEKSNNEWYISDMGSSNGTSLNSGLLRPKERRKLTNGDVIKFADLSMEVDIC